MTFADLKGSAERAKVATRYLEEVRDASILDNHHLGQERYKSLEIIDQLDVELRHIRNYCESTAEMMQGCDRDGPDFETGLCVPAVVLSPNGDFLFQFLTQNCKVPKYPEDPERPAIGELTNSQLCLLLSELRGQPQRIHVSVEP